MRDANPGRVYALSPEVQRFRLGPAAFLYPIPYPELRFFFIHSTLHLPDACFCFTFECGTSLFRSDDADVGK